MAAGGTRAILSLVALVLLAGGIVLQLLVILSGLNGAPETSIYFLEANTEAITGGNDAFRNPARWTYLRICGVENGRNANCNPTGAAIPFDPERNFGTTTGVPEALLGNMDFYLSRTSWAFYIVALFFAAAALLVSLAALFARLGAYLTGFFAFLAMIFQGLCSALMTAWTIRGRNAFRANGGEARLGLYAYGFSWAAFACFVIATALFCAGGSVGKDKSSSSKSYFGRKKNARSRGSFIDSSSDRRVKDEYE